MISSRLVLTAAWCAFAVSTAAADGNDPYPLQPTYGESQAASAASGDRVSQPGQGGRYDWESVSTKQRVVEGPLPEHMSPAKSLVVFAAAILTGLLTIVGLALSYRSLRADIRRSRVPTYRPRGPHSQHEEA
jgi:hypothetical protein